MGKTVKNFYTGGEELTEEQKANARDYGKHQDEQKKALLEKQDEFKEKIKSVDFMNAPFDPFEDRILVYPDVVELKANNGIIIPDEIKNKVKPLTGTVVAVGPGKMNRNGVLEVPPLQKGWKIYYGNYAGTEITLNEVKYLIMRYADTFGRVV